MKTAGAGGWVVRVGRILDKHIYRPDAAHGKMDSTSGDLKGDAQAWDPKQRSLNSDGHKISYLLSISAKTHLSNKIYICQPFRICFIH